MTDKKRIVIYVDQAVHAHLESLAAQAKERDLFKRDVPAHEVARYAMMYGLIQLEQPARKGRKRGPRHCSGCGKQGHDIRQCETE